MLQGELVHLRALERADLPALVRWFNTPEVRRLLARVEPVSLAEEERWFEALLRSTTEVAFGIVDARDGRLLGTCGLHRIDWRNRGAALRIVVSDAVDRGCGKGSDALRALLQHAFASLGLHRVELEVLVDNAAAVRCYERLGFVHEGSRKDARYLDGAFVDLALMRMLAPEWAQASSRRPQRRKRA